MRRSEIKASCVGLVWLAVAGCATPPVARYVYQDNEFGVVAIPANTYFTKLNFRGEADELMMRHFPEGYEIVRAEEVDEGQRTIDVGRKTDIETAPYLTSLNQMVRLGKVERAASFEEKDMTHIRECRIIYKRKAPGAAGPTGQFAAVSSVGPKLYVDPNEMLRHQVQETLLAKANSGSKKPDDTHGDPKVKQAAGTASK